MVTSVESVFSNFSLRKTKMESGSFLRTLKSL